MNSENRESVAINRFTRDAADYGVAEERRQSPRHAVDAILVIQPVDERGNPCGNTAIGRCRDISEGGISFICKRPIGSPFLQLDSMTPGFGLVAATIEVVRVQPTDDQFEIAGKLVTLPVDRTS